jgi:LacI family transcriptional regulator
MPPTINDVAKHTGLSVGTISKHLNGIPVKPRNRLRIEKAIDELNYKVNEFARGLKTNTTKTIGILIPNLDNVFATTIVSIVEDRLLQYGYSTIICDYKDDGKLENEKLNFLVDKMADGIIFMPTGNCHDGIRSMLESRKPIVLIDRMIEGIECDVVMIDNLNASYHAIEHMIANGHKRIGVITGQKNSFTSRERLKGYCRVHEDYGIPVDEQLIQFGDYKFESGHQLCQKLMKLESPITGLLVANYKMTMGAVMALNELNVNIPRDISIIGFGDLDMIRLIKPALTVVSQPMKEIGEIAVSLLLKRLRDDFSNYPTIVRQKTKLVERDSVMKR